MLRGERLDHRTIRAWSTLMVRIFGFRVRRYGKRNIPYGEAAE